METAKPVLYIQENGGNVNDNPLNPFFLRLPPITQSFGLVRLIQIRIIGLTESIMTLSPARGTSVRRTKKLCTRIVVDFSEL